MTPSMSDSRKRKSDNNDDDDESRRLRARSSTSSGLYVESPDETQRKVAKRKPKASSRNQNQVKSLAYLNDDCLRSIIQFTDIHDCLHLALTSSRFFCFTVEHLESNEVCLFRKKCFSRAQLKKLLPRFGPYMKRLDVCHGWIDYGLPRNVTSFDPLVLEHCVNIEEINISERKLSEVTNLLLANRNSLKALTAISCQLSDEDCRVISDLTELESLDLSKNEHITGQFLTALTNLRHLRIAFCTSFSPFYFSEICSRNSLKSIDIYRCNELTDSSFDTLLETQSECLESVSISHPYMLTDVRILTELKALKHFEISFQEAYGYFDEMLLVDLARHHASTLESLTINGIRELCDSELASILRLENLKRLEICVKPVSRNFLFDLAVFCPHLEFLKANASRKVTKKLRGILRDSFKNLKKLSISWIYMYCSDRY